MDHDSTVYVGLDVHKESITTAYAVGMGDVELLGRITGLPRVISIVCANACIPRAGVCMSSTRQDRAVMDSTVNWSRKDSNVWYVHRH